MGARWLARIVIAALAFGVATAAAQPVPADPIEQSRRLYDQATVDYRVAKFDQALVGYEAAYELYAAPQFLFNIAQCHFQLQHWERAVFFFEGYLRELPDAANRALVDELMAEARERGAAQREADRRLLELEQARLEEDRKAKEREAEERARLTANLLRVETPPDRPVYKKWWFWSLVGGAVAGVAVTAAVTGGGTRSVLPEGSLGTWDRR